MERIELTAPARIACRAHTITSVRVKFREIHVCFLAFNAVLERNIQRCGELVKNLGRQPPGQQSLRAKNHPEILMDA